jgi:hypothetical protein
MLSMLGLIFDKRLPRFNLNVVETSHHMTLYGRGKLIRLKEMYVVI